MNKRIAGVAVASLFFAASSSAQPTVPDGFVARLIAPLLDGQIPQLSAIDDPDFGTGVVTATLANGIANFRLLEPNGVLSTIGVWEQAPASGFVIRVILDTDGIIDGLLHATVSDLSQQDTHYMTISPQGVVTQQWERTEAEQYDFVITTGGAGLPIGAVILDSQANNGTWLGEMNTQFGVTIVDTDSVPPDRSDTDVTGFQRDVTGLYGGGLLLADSDWNTDEMAAIYELRDVVQGGTYRAIFGPVHSVTPRYGDLAIAATGDFGGVIYVTEMPNDEIQQVTPDGAHTTWATGFTGIDSLSISPDGQSMYVGDLNGVWLIRASGNEAGPIVLTHEPNDSGGSYLTGEATNFFRIIFDESVSFTDADVTITSKNGEPVPFDASGSRSQFMLIGLGQPLFANTYTITIADTVTSVATGQPLDGDNDGFAGGDAIIEITHQCPADIDGDGDADADDFFQYLDHFAQSCPD